MTEHSESFASGRLSRLLRLLLFGSVLLPALVFGVVAVADRHEVLAAAEANVLRTLDVLREHTIKVLETHALVLDVVAGRLREFEFFDSRNVDTLSAVLEELDRPREQIASIWVLDSSGRAVAGSVPFSTGLNAQDRDYFQVHRTADVGTYIGKAYVGRTTNRPSFSVTRRVPSEGEFKGIILIAVAAEYFEEFWSEATLPSGVAAALVRADGEVLARYPPIRPVPPRVPAELMASLEASDRGLRWLRSPVDGAERIVGYEKIAKYPIYISFGIDRAVALAPWYGHLKLYGMVGGASSLVLFFVALFALRRARLEELAVKRLSAEIGRREVAEAALQEAQRLESLGRLTGGVAHDFNNLLTAIFGNIEFIQRRSSDQKVAKAAGAALRAAERGAALTAQLLAFARKQHLVPQPTDLNEVVESLAGMLKRTLGAGIQITIKRTEALPPALVDPTQLEVALLNLAVNARDAMPNGGSLTIETFALTGKASDCTAVEDLARGDYVGVSVSDTGAGMTDDVRSRAFEPFFTTKSIGQGSGLGLSQVLGFAKQSLGATKLESAIGEGTTVTIYLPAADDADVPSPMRTTSTTRPEPPGRSSRLGEDASAIGARDASEPLER